MGDESTAGAPAGLFRRLAALLYDILLVMALAVVATFAMLPLSHGEALLASTQGIVGHAYHAAWLLLVFAYFAWCWLRSGQTLGLRAWRIRLERRDGRRIGWAGAALRYLAGLALGWLALAGAWYLGRPGGALATAGAAAMIAPLVANFAWIPFDRERRSLIDLAGGARVVRAG